MCVGVGKRGLATGLNSNLFFSTCRCENVKQMIEDKLLKCWCHLILHNPLLSDLERTQTHYIHLMGTCFVLRRLVLQGLVLFYGDLFHSLFAVTLDFDPQTQKTLGQLSSFRWIISLVYHNVSYHPAHISLGKNN